MGFLLEHGDAKAAGKRLFAGVNAQVSLQVPRHAELLAAVVATVFAYRSYRAGRWLAGRASVAGREGGVGAAAGAVAAALVLVVGMLVLLVMMVIRVVFGLNLGLGFHEAVVGR